MANEKLTKLDGGMLRYRYDIDGSGEVAFDFNTLAEVGEPYQPWFREEIAKRGWVVEFGRDLDEKPYVADFVVGSQEVTGSLNESSKQGVSMQKVWIYFPGNEAAAQQVIGLGHVDGIVIPAETLADLRRRGVCTDVHVGYPGTAPKVTEGVAHHGFRVPSVDGKSAAKPDTWLRIEVPSNSDSAEG